MFSNYFTVAWRNLAKNKVFSLINIGGLAVGMAVALLIGLWIWDELTFNQVHTHYARIAKVMQTATANGETGTQANIPYPVGETLRAKFGSDFRFIVMSTSTDNHILTYGKKKLKQQGRYMEPDAPDLLSLTMARGNYRALKDPSSILFSASVARSFFGTADPLGKLLSIDNNKTVKVTGVYADLPGNSDFREVAFIAPWELYLETEKWITGMHDAWGWNAWYTYVQMAGNAGFGSVSKKIKNIKQDNVSNDDKKYGWQLFLDPMPDWHLYDDFRNGVRDGGLIEFVWLFGSIGLCVLLLACINFMNLSTARAEKRAKEVGIRKAIGSRRWQLILQFFSESLLVVLFAFMLALLLAQLSLPAFNQVSGKHIALPWSSLSFWLAGLVFCIVTGLTAGSYPAFYLSAFKPVKVLKGVFRAGRFAAFPRRVLVVLQFSISVMLGIGTLVIFRQVEFAKNRPSGYNKDGLIMSQMLTHDIHEHFAAVSAELQQAGSVSSLAESGSPATGIWSTNGNISWEGKDPSQAVDFPNTGVGYDYGKTVGWQFVAGRDFSRSFGTDSAGFILNESAVKFMGLKDPVGKIIRWGGSPFTVIGVIKDMIMGSPYEPVPGSLFYLSSRPGNFIIMRLNPATGTRPALHAIEAVFNKYSPSVPFDYSFVDAEYARKFGDEERIGKLTGFFCMLALFISCLGLSGMASFMAAQRTREIGLRKVLGATVFQVWHMLSKEFVVLIVIALLVATPVAYYAMFRWLQHYAYRSALSWWIFVLTGLAAIAVTLVTVSFQAVKAGLTNPVNSLRSE